MQTSIIKYSDIVKAKRFDAEYFKPEYLNILNIIRKYKFLPNRKISYIKSGTTPKDRDDKLRNGVILLKTSNIRNNVLIYEPSNFFYISNEVHKKMRSTELKENDVLINIVGATTDVIGRTAFIPCGFPKANITQAMAFCRVINPEFKPAYLFIFFQTKFGILQIQRLARPTGQFNLNLQEVGQLLIPLLPQSFQLQIEKIVKQAYQNQSKSKELYKEAEQLLLEELDLLNYKPKHKLTFTATKKQVDDARRFDAEYFQPKYAEIIKKIESYKGGWEYVRNVLNIKDKNYNPEEEKEYKYIELSNISTDGNIEGFTKDIGKELPTRARRIVKTGDLIVSSIEGSLDSVALVTEEYNNSLCSTGFYVVDSEKLNSETLLVLTKSIALQMQLKKGCKGTILTAIPKDELKKIKIPIITPQIQNQIAEKIQESHRLRQEAKTLLEKAKKMVEEEIESRADVI